MTATAFEANPLRSSGRCNKSHPDHVFGFGELMISWAERAACFPRNRRAAERIVVYFSPSKFPFKKLLLP